MHCNANMVGAYSEFVQGDMHAHVTSSMLLLKPRLSYQLSIMTHIVLTCTVLAFSKKEGKSFIAKFDV